MQMDTTRKMQASSNRAAKNPKPPGGGRTHGRASDNTSSSKGKGSGGGHQNAQSLAVGGVATGTATKKASNPESQNNGTESMSSQSKTKKNIEANSAGAETNMKSNQREPETATEPPQPNKPRTQAAPKKKLKKSIFVSYSPDAEFTERRFVAETVSQLKENNMAEDLWFDKDEKNTGSPCWFSLRMEAVERCHAAVLFMSDSYFTCPVSVYEGKALMERARDDPNSVHIYPVLLALSPQTEVPRVFDSLFSKAVDLTTADQQKKSLAERSSVTVGSLMPELEKHACIRAAPPPDIAPDAEFTGEYAKKKICQWTVSDLQEWLFKLGIKEFYRQSLAENAIDGFLLLSLTDQDMIQHLGVDSRAVRKKIMQQILSMLDKELKASDSWHLRARSQRPKPGVVYLVYDPADVRLAQHLKQDLNQKTLQVTHHEKLGQSKLEFLQLNSSLMSSAAHVLILQTEGATNSPFVFHEVLFADWLGKKLVTVMFKNTWSDLRPSMKAVLGDCPAVDFESKLYTESLSVLHHHLKPLRSVPGVVLEQTYLNKMSEGVRPLSLLSNVNYGSEWSTEEPQNKVFISYQWDTQSKVDDIKRHLEASGFSCWVDVAPTMATGQRGCHSSISNRSSEAGGATTSESLQSQIQRNMKAASVVLCCVTPKYMQSDNCIKDLTLAEILHKPIIPIMLRFCPWPPEGAPPQVRMIMVRHAPTDLSNEKVFKLNIHSLVDRVKKAAAGNRRVGGF